MKKLLIPIFLITIFFVALLLLFEVKNVHVIGSTACLEETALLSKVYKKNIFLLDTQNLKDKIKKQKPCLEDLVVTKKYPNTINFQVVAREAVAKIDGSEYFVTDDGLIVSGAAGTLKPKIFLPQGVEVKVDEKIKDTSVLFALKLTKNLEKSDFTPANVRITEQGDIAIYSNQEAVALFTQEKSADSQVDSLQSVIAKAKIDPSKIAKIDLRFDNPVVIYKQQ